MLRSSLALGFARLAPIRPEDGAALADYHRIESAHLKPWDIAWDPRRCDALWQARRIEASAGPQPDGSGMRPAHGFGLWAPQDPRQAERLVGLITLEIIRGGNPGEPVLGLAYSLAAQSQGRGWMFEALQALWPSVAAGFGGRCQIWAHVREDNHRSARLLQRLGFEDRGVDPEFPVVACEGVWRRHHRWILPLGVLG